MPSPAIPPSKRGLIRALRGLRSSSSHFGRHCSKRDRPRVGTPISPCVHRLRAPLLRARSRARPGFPCREGARAPALHRGIRLPDGRRAWAGHRVAQRLAPPNLPGMIVRPRRDSRGDVRRDQQAPGSCRAARPWSQRQVLRALPALVERPHECVLSTQTRRRATEARVA